MSQEVEHFFYKIEEFIENPIDFYAVFWYLPYHNQYLLILRLIKYKSYLTEGCIKITDEEILISNNYGNITLLILPQPYEL